ncbi:MAG: MFS transporter [Deltaproteobacteria bacterium]|nr:MFS transporter [Deltaproteobacteria bacterium]
MQLLALGGILAYIITLYFMRNPLKHSKRFMWTRFLSWFPLGMTYSFMYMARYNLDALATADVITKAQKSLISGWGFFVYAIALFVTGPLIDRIGGKKGMIMAALGAGIFNVLMGWALFLYLKDKRSVNIVAALTVLYSCNMFFQSFGAISTIKVKSFWFHVRERGTFGAIFGTLISLGVYYAFDWIEAIVQAVRVDYTGPPSAFRDFMQAFFIPRGPTMSSFWLLFFVPAGFLFFWALVDLLLIKDTPDEAGFGRFETHDASHGDHTDFSTWFKVIKAILSNKILLMIGAIEFSSGILRDGVMKWYRLYAKDTGLGVPSILEHWGLLACLTGIVGGFFAGMISDKYFHSRRAPVAGILQVAMFAATLVMLVAISTQPKLVGAGCLVVMAAVIGVHSIMSGTATADFGGRKGAATATGVADGFSKLGSSFQEFVLGAVLTKQTWHYWPSFLIPATLFGLFFAIRLWTKLPEGTRKYLREVEKIKVSA